MDQNNSEYVHFLRSVKENYYSGSHNILVVITYIHLMHKKELKAVERFSLNFLQIGIKLFDYPL